MRLSRSKIYFCESGLKNKWSEMLIFTGHPAYIYMSIYQVFHNNNYQHFAIESTIDFNHFNFAMSAESIKYIQDGDKN